jgi:hypothetical protein
MVWGGQEGEKVSMDIMSMRKYQGVKGWG